VTTGLDERARSGHKRRNILNTILLLAGTWCVLALSCWLLWGVPGVVVTTVWLFLLASFSERMPPELMMRLYRGQKIDPVHGGQLTEIVTALATRAELPTVPDVYVIPSMTLNAFATGTPRHAVIGITEGLLRRLTLREITGVLAHEISHVRNNDLRLMGLADAITRFTVALPYAAVFLAILNLLGAPLGEVYASWSAILLLYAAPTLASLLQLALSRTREFDADLEGALLTGDPLGLASALHRLERYTGRVWEDMMMPVPVRRIPQPSILRTHPDTEDRVRRLRELDGRTMPAPPLNVAERPMISLVGVGPIQLRPRYRWPGLWY
jgi:heat shock protein HtpX